MNPAMKLRCSQRTGSQQMPAGDSSSLALGIDHQLDDESRARRAIFNRLSAIENEMKTLGSGGFASFLVAICIGVAAALAWQSYDLAALRQVSANQDQVASKITKLQSVDMELLAKITPPPAHPSVAPTIDPERLHEIASDLAALRQTVERISAGQDQTAGEIAKLQGENVELLAKIPSPRAQSAYVRKATPTALRPSRALIPFQP